MPDPLRERIAANLRSLSDEELLAIWVTNDRASWSDTAFELVKAILTERGIELPEQVAPPAAGDSDEEAGEPIAEADAEPQGEPVFYRPDEVFSLARTIRWLAPAAVIVTVVAFLPQWLTLGRSVASYFPNSRFGAFLGAVIALPLGGLIIALQSALIYFGLKAVAAVLRILMEMEFNSRGRSFQESEP
jgi:hypothetical protein